jgi:hypothetical protein
MSAAPRQDELRVVERWFTARGTPHLIEGYNASEDVFTRALPVLSFVFLAEMAAALNSDWTWWQNVLAGAGGLASLIGIWALANRIRRRPPLERPARVGPVEIAVFVLGPPLVPLAFGGQVGSAVAVVVLNLVLLGVVYVTTSYGLVPLTRWAVVKAARELESVGPLLGRSLPLLLLITIVLFVNAEMWQVAAGFDGPSLVAAVALLFAVGLGFLLVRLPRELGRLGRFDAEDDVRAQVVGTPAAALLSPQTERATAAATGTWPLGRRQRANVLLVALVSQGVPVIVTTVAVGAFFVVLGLLLAPPEVVVAWVGGQPHVLAEVAWLGRPVELTAELLTVAGFLAAFSGLYFSVVVVADATYREEFLDEILAELRQTLAVRAVYLAARAG